MVGLVIMSEIWVGNQAETSVQAMSAAKASGTLTRTITRGILCNWLVCVAVLFATAAKDIGGKIVGIIMPISAFIALGFDHSVVGFLLTPSPLVVNATRAVTALTFLGMQRLHRALY